MSALAVAHQRTELLNEELKAKNERLGQDAALLRRAAAVTQSGSVVMNFRTGEVLAAAGLSTVLGVEEPHGARAFLAFVAENPELDDAVADCLSKGIPFDLDAKCTVDGTSVWLHVSGRDTQNPATGEGWLVGVVQNIDARKRHERELESRSRGLASALEEAKAAARAKTEFLAKMSHELRTPLNAILGSVRLIETTDRSADERQLFEALGAGSQRLEEVVDEILVVSDLNGGALTLENLPFDASDVVRQVLLDFADRASEHRVRLSFEVDAGRALQFRGDPRRFRQVLAALVSNGIKFSSGGHVRVRAGVRDPGRLLLSIADDGIGIEEKAQRAIFEAFAQVSEGNRRRFGGTGLGLTLAHRLTVAMGGTLILESTLGAGTTVTLDIPFEPAPERETPDLSQVQFRWHGPPSLGGELQALRAAGAEAAPRDAASALDIWMHAADDPHRDHRAGIHLWPGRSPCPVGTSSTIHLQQPVAREALLAAAERCSKASPDSPRAPPEPFQVLVVDDGATNRLVVGRLLKRLGVAAEMVDGGEAAVARCQEKDFDLVLMDLQMPDVDGFEATRRILRSRPETYVVALTANALTEHREASRAAGMRGFLTKPVTPAELEVLLRTLSPKH